MELVRQKNAATYITFPIVDADGDFVTGATGLDSEIDAWTDGAAPDGFADCTNEATEIGSTGIYYLSLTQTEMNNDYIVVQVKTSSVGAKTQMILINTMVGDPLNRATTDDGGTINVAAGVVEAAVQSIVNNAITANSIASDAITAAKVADGAIDAATFAAGAITATVIADGAIDAATFAAGAITATVIATGAVDADALAADAVTEIQSGLATQTSVDTIDDFLDTEVADILAAVDTEVAAILALLDDARGEPGQGAPPVNPDAMTKLDYLYKAFRNKQTQTSTTWSLYADDASTVDQKATVSDDATTFTRGEIATGP